MPLAEKKLTTRESSELEDWLRQAANDVLAGHGWENS
jgi:hypothetical protein